THRRHGQSRSATFGRDSAARHSLGGHAAVPVAIRRPREQRNQGNARSDAVRRLRTNSGPTGSELLDALAWDCLADLPLRDVYLPDLASVLDLPGRLCVGGVVALCAIARHASRLRGPADYVLLVQERSGSVLNAARRLSVIPNGFHQ